MQIALLNWLQEPFDAANEDHATALTLGGWFLLSAFLNPAKWAVFWLWLPALFWFEAYPEDMIDSAGYVLPGFGSVAARTRDMIKMLWFDYEPYMSNPDGKDLTLEKDDFFNSILIVLVNWIFGDILDYFLGGFPFACQAFFMLFNMVFV